MFFVIVSKFVCISFPHLTQNTSQLVTNDDNRLKLVSNTAIKMDDWSIDGLGAGRRSDEKDSVHLHLSFQSRVGPVQWLK